MLIAGTPLHDVTGQHIQELIENAVPESLVLDYKRDSYGRSDNDKKELLKDVSAFANSSGGVIIIGVDEATGLPSSITPISIDPDKELLRLEGIIRTGIEPRIIGLQTRAITVDGGHVLIISIEKSWNPPHRVTAKSHNRFWLRNSNGKHEANVDELRVMFTSAADAIARVKNYTLERAAVISSNQGLYPLPKKTERRPGIMVYQLIPLSAFGRAQEHSVAAIEMHRGFLSPPTRQGRFQRNLQGACVYDEYWLPNQASPTGTFEYYVQLYRSGIIEWVQTAIGQRGSEGETIAPSRNIERHIVEGSFRLLSILKHLQEHGPFLLAISLKEMKNSFWHIGDNFRTMTSGNQFHHESLDLPVFEIISHPSDLYEMGRLLRPLLDTLWNAFGYEACENYTNEGDWKYRS